jgi:tRNA dimethylallyltransferase
LAVDSSTPIPIICGPTGSGKTAIAVALAGNYPVEIVSADSRQLIKYLNIGTAKPTTEEQKLVRFHLIDIVEPGERYSAYRFASEVEKVIGEILEREHIPLVVGGTGLYLRALSEGVIEIEEQDMQLRERLEQEMKETGPDAMYRKLEGIDPLEAARLHPNNQVRVIRALEIYYLTGKTKSELVVTGSYNKSDRNYSYYCLALPREKLYERINDRVERMMTEGLLEELRCLIEQGKGEGIKKANVIGYAELIEYIEGSCSLEAAVDMIKQNSRRYAKRQMTWFRHQFECRMFADAESLCKSLALR